MPRVLAGRYQLDVCLGSGGQGQVFRGQDLVTKATVAIKLMDQGGSPEALARFQQEGRLAARIRDPHLLAALHFGVSEEQHFIVFDYIPRVVPLSTMFDHGRIEPARVCDVALQVLDALTSLHEAGVVHQDVSPANILWRERDTGRIEAFLVDLGSATARSPVTGAPRRPDGPMGTSNYMAPEMEFGEDWDHRADLWSVGALMYVLLTGCEVDIGEADQPLGIPPPVLLVPSVPQAVSDVVARALADAEQRYPSATAMAEAIRAAVSAEQALVKPQRPPGVPKRAAFGGMAIAAVVAVIGTITAQRALGTTLTPSSAPLELAASRLDAPVLALPSPEGPLKIPEPSPPPTPASAPVEPTMDVQGALTPTSPPSARKPRTLTWPAVERAVKQKAAALRKCSKDDYISLGLQVSGGRAKLKSFDGNPVPSSPSPPARPHHRCVFEIVTQLRFAGGEIAGVVGVPLD